MLLNVLILSITALVSVSVVVDVRRQTQPIKSKQQDPTDQSEAHSNRKFRVISPYLRREMTWRRSTWAALLSVGLLFTLIGQRAVVRQTPHDLQYLVWIAGCSAVAFGIAHAGIDVRYRQPTAILSKFLPLDWSRSALLATSAVCAVLAYDANQTRALGESANDIVAVWLISMLYLALGVFGVDRLPSLGSVKRWLAPRLAEIAGLLALTAIALASRLFPFGSYPSSMSGDEGMFADQAQRVISGEIANPFYVGYQGHVTITFFTNSWAMQLLGQSLGSVRLPSAIFGALAVVSTYLLARHHYGRPAAWMSAFAGTVLSVGLFWSRNSQSNASVFFFVPLAILLLDRGLVGRRTRPALFAGMTIGLSLLFNPASRILLPIALGYLIYATVYPFPRSVQRARDSLRSLMPPLGALIAGFLVTAAPLLGHFSGHPGSFSSRSNQVSIFTTGWIESESQTRGRSELHLLRDQFLEVLRLPFGNAGQGNFYHADPPLVGLPMAIPSAIGLAYISIWFWKRQNFGFALTFWGTTLAVTLTVNPGETSRYGAVIALLPVYMAVGLYGTGVATIKLLRIDRKLVGAATVLVTAAIVVSHAGFYFGDEHHYEHVSDARTHIANAIAREAVALGDDVVVYMGTPPAMYWGSHYIDFLAQNAKGIDLLVPLTRNDEAPDLAGTTLFVFLPERMNELSVVENWFPHGIRNDRFIDPYGLVYTSLTVTENE